MEQALNDVDRIVFDAENAGGPDKYDEDEFRIMDDGAAGWAMRKIKQAQENHKAFKFECDKRKARLEEALAEIEAREKQSESDMIHRTQYFTDALQRYFETLPSERVKATKTQRQYMLPEGKLVRKTQEPEYKRDDARLVAWFKKIGKDDLIKVIESPKWIDAKPFMKFVGGFAYDKETGEEVPGVTVVDKPDVFEIKF